MPYDASRQAPIFDNSTLASGKYLKIGKLTLQWFMNFNEANILHMAVWKDKESNGAPTIDNETTIRDMRSEGRLIRGPWQISSRGPGIESANTIHQRKTIVLEDLLLDPNDDLRFGYSVRGPLGTSSGTNDLYISTKTFWRVSE